ncbi:hypothetical protein [Halorhabdus rudnickae]|uniref:hypothetical protein n=1 Tax=Halorhabdus rudnickae TaxID=1775544 RepID=UPI001082CF93|nr:hypothetical protein [Halorhabdus rudnickae]
MADNETVIRSQAEQVAEYHGVSAHNRQVVERIMRDGLFRRLALAHHHASEAVELVGSDGRVPGPGLETRAIGEQTNEAADELLNQLRTRGELLLPEDAVES